MTGAGELEDDGVEGGGVEGEVRSEGGGHLDDLLGEEGVRLSGDQLVDACRRADRRSRRCCQVVRGERGDEARGEGEWEDLASERHLWSHFVSQLALPNRRRKQKVILMGLRDPI